MKHQKKMNSMNIYEEALKRYKERLEKAKTRDENMSELVCKLRLSEIKQKRRFYEDLIKRREHNRASAKKFLTILAEELERKKDENN